MKCFKMGYVRKNWIYLAQDMRQGRTATNTHGFLNIRDFFHQIGGGGLLLWV